MAKSTVGSLWINIKANTMGLAKGLGKSRGMLGKFGKFAKSPAGMATIAFAGLTAGIYAMGRALVSAVKVWMDFDKAMSKVKSIMLSATNNEFKRLTDQAKMLGATTANTATEIAEAMANLGRAGFDTSEIEASVKSVSNLANATGMEMAEASDILAVGVRAFGLEAGESARVADVLALTASKTNTTVQELGEGMKYVAPIAKQLGFSIEETSAMLGKLADAGIKSTMGGTALRKIMLSLGTDIEEHGTKAFYDFMSVQHGVTENFMKFGARAVTASGVLQDMSKETAELTGELDKASGTADEMARISLDNLSGDVTILTSAVSGLAVAIGEQLDPALRTATQSATGFFSGLTAGFEALDNGVEGTSSSLNLWNGLLLGVGTVVLALAGVVKFLWNAVQMAFYAIAGIVSGALSAVMDGLKWATKGVQAFMGIFMDTSDWDVGNVFADMATELNRESVALWTTADEQAGEGVHALGLGLAEGVSAQYNALFGAGEELGNGVGTGIAKGVEDSTKKARKPIADSLADMLTKMSDWKISLQDEWDFQGWETWEINANKAIALLDKMGGQEEEIANIWEMIDFKNHLDDLVELEEKMKSMKKESETIFESVMTPFEKFESEKANLDKIFSNGFLSDETYDRALKKLEKTLEDTKAKIEVGVNSEGFVAGVTEGLQTAMGTIKIAGEVTKSELMAEKTLSVQKNMQSLTEAVKQSTKKTADVLSGTVETEVNGLQEAVTSGVTSATVTANMNADVLEALAEKNNEINTKGFENVVQELKNLATKSSPLT
tara:strand:- start:486 stop:2840 length:2355 start_codon:yes stop_codon:yes gene_type:complete